MTVVRLTGPRGPRGDGGVSTSKVHVWYTEGVPEIDQLVTIDDTGNPVGAAKQGDWVVTGEPAIYRVDSPTTVTKVGALPAGPAGPPGDPIPTPPPPHTHMASVVTTYQMIVDAFTPTPNLNMTTVVIL